MMKLVLFGIFALMARPTKADCRDLTLDRCERESEPFETFNDVAKVTKCQEFCKSFPNKCTFFVYNKVQLTCEIFDTDIQIYKDSCHKLGLTPDVEVPECYNSTDSFLADPCLNFIEGYCKFFGNVYEDILADNVNLCQIRASIFDAPYFWYNDDTKNCKLISSSERQCDQIIGTPTPEYEPVYCGDEIPKSCPEGWLDSPEGCFYFATDVGPMTWDMAVGHCQELGGYLAEVLNDETQRLLVEQATALGTSTNWWLGATDQASEGVWVWTKTGKLVDLDSQSWYGDQPSNGIPLGPSSDSYQNQDCLHLYAPWGYQWDDLNCFEMAWGGNVTTGLNPNKPICQKRL